MLVLTRKLDESIDIGNDIKLRILRLTGGSVRLGIEAPPDVRVLRSELGVFDDGDDGSGNKTDTAQPSAA